MGLSGSKKPLQRGKQERASEQLGGRGWLFPGPALGQWRQPETLDISPEPPALLFLPGFLPLCSSSK